MYHLYHFRLLKLLIFMALLMSGGLCACAQETLLLYPDGKIPNVRPGHFEEKVLRFPQNGHTIRFITDVTVPELTVYLPKKQKHGSMAVIICPGGGYSGVAIDHEGHDMAMKLQKNGIAGVVLKYRMPHHKYVNNKNVVPLQDAQRAIQIVRENAREWGIDPHNIGIAGSSAGGHLAATAATHYRQVQIDNPKNTSLRPDFLILNYPVISFADSLTHCGSRFNLIGELPDAELDAIMADWQHSEERLRAQPVSAELVRLYSNELQVTSETPPTFITHAVDDEVVKVQNSLLFMAALQQHQVPVQSFFYAKGGHGYGMDNPGSAVQWMDICIDWLQVMRKK